MGERGKIESADTSDLVENAKESFLHQGSIFPEAGCYWVEETGLATKGAKYQP